MARAFFAWELGGDLGHARRTLQIARELRDLGHETAFAFLDLASLGVQAITMINGNRQPIAVPSVLGSDGASFAVTRTQNPSTGAAGTGRRRRG